MATAANDPQKGGGLLRTLTDGLANLMSGSGTSVDKKTHREWQTRIMAQTEIEQAYRGNWLLRKIVNLPPWDMTRNWREWQAENAQIEELEEQEMILGVQEKVRRGLVLGRLGGGAILMGIEQTTAETPLDVERVTQGQLKYLYVLSRWQMKLENIQTDPNKPDFGEPEFFVLRNKAQQEVRVHRSRFIVFKGEFSGAGQLTTGTSNSEDAYWGDSVVQSVNDPVMNATETCDEIAGLVAEAKVDVIGIPDLLAKMGDPVREKQVMRRLELAQIGKSNHRALIKDKDEDFEQRQVVWAGMSELIRTNLSVAAGAADIPATRLLGKSADGMNATGEGDERNYHEMIQSKQASELKPALAPMDEVLIRHTFGTRDDDIHYIFAPLRVSTPKEDAEIEKSEVDSVQVIADSGLIPEEALARSLVNRLVESGRWPGLEGYLEDIGEKWWEVAAEEREEDLPEPPAPSPAPAPRPAPAPTQ